MANRNYPASRTFGFNLLPARLITKFNVGSSGAVSNVKTNNGVAAVTRLAVGTYQIQMQDNYAAFLSARHIIHSPLSGTPVAATALTPGVVYQIVSLGTTTQAQWVTAGVPAGITAAPGVSFLAAATSSGTGSAQTAISSGITSMELIGGPDTSLSNQPFVAGLGGFVNIVFWGPTDATHTALIPTDPVNGSIVRLEFLMNNSQVQ